MDGEKKGIVINREEPTITEHQYWEIGMRLEGFHDGKWYKATVTRVPKSKEISQWDGISILFDGEKQKVPIRRSRILSDTRKVSKNGFPMTNLKFRCDSTDL